MNILDLCIVEIYSIKERNHTVAINMQTDCYGAKETKTYYFEKIVWERIKNKKSFPETADIDEHFADYLDSMSDDHYYGKFQKKLKDYTDEEICEEFNKRANDRIFHHIGLSIVTDGVVKEIKATVEK